MPPRQMRLRYAILLLTLLSCTNKQRGGAKTLDFGEFTIDVPSTWQPVRAKGIDSYVGLMTLDHGDTVSFDLGWYSNPLEEEYKFMVENGDVYLKKENESTSNSVFFEFYGKADTVDIENFKVNNVTWTIIDGKRAKLVQPKNIGTGMTGIYFDSLWVAGSGIDRFQMNGKDLHPDNERQLLKAFETLKFNKK
jgi:hypothetical protein